LAANQQPSKPGPNVSARTVAFAVYDGIRLLDLTGPLDAFALVNERRAVGGQPPYYSLRVFSERGGPVRTTSGLEVSSEPLSALNGEQIDTLVAVGGALELRPASNLATVENWLEGQRKLVDFIAQDGSDARRICSVCTGTFLLAGARLLSGRTVATHWGLAQLLATCFPDLQVEPDRIFLRDGPIWTSGGITAGIDLALALIEDDLGSEFALQIARVMVVFANRPGGQSQFSIPLAAPLHRGDFEPLHTFIAKHLAEDLRIEDLAAHAGMSRRTFMRAYVAETGRTPAKTIESMRLGAARMALEATNKSLKEIARETGFGNEDRLRRVFQRQLGVSPADYRTRFSMRARAERAVLKTPTGFDVN
jgi:transcriptional regulator GlxA family with amidase domain